MNTILTEIQTKPAKNLSVTDGGDVLVWSSCNFDDPKPLLLVDYSAGDIAKRFGYTSTSEIPSETLSQAWWVHLSQALAPDEIRFVVSMIEQQRNIPVLRRDQWKVYGFYTEQRLRAERIAMRVGAHDQDNDAWRRISEAATQTHAIVDVLDQFEEAGPVALPVTIVELWWNISDTVSVFSWVGLTELWEEFKEQKYTRGV